MSTPMSGVKRTADDLEAEPDLPRYVPRVISIDFETNLADDDPVTTFNAGPHPSVGPKTQLRDIEMADTTIDATIQDDETVRGDSRLRDTPSAPGQSLNNSINASLTSILSPDNLQLPSRSRPRGAPKGSGKGIAKKTNDQLSQTQGAVTQRNRRKTMSAEEREMDLAKKADSRAVQRARAKLRGSDEFIMMSDEAQSTALTRIENEVRRKRDQENRSASALAEIMALKNLRLEDSVLEDGELLAAHRDIGVTDFNTGNEWWDDLSDDEGDAEPPIRVDSDYKATVDDVIFGQTFEVPVTGKLSGVVASRAAKSVAFRSVHKQQLEKKSQAVLWCGFRSHWISTLESLKLKLYFLEYLGEPLHFDTTDQNTVTGVSGRWIKYLYIDNNGHEIKPHNYFNVSERGALRCVIGARDHKNYDLPGPAIWWPNDAEYYTRWGFEPRSDSRDDYRKALQALNYDDPPENWEKSLLHDRGKYDLIWRPHFVGLDAMGTKRV